MYDYKCFWSTVECLKCGVEERVYLPALIEEDTVTFFECECGKKLVELTTTEKEWLYGKIIKAAELNEELNGETLFRLRKLL